MTYRNRALLDLAKLAPCCMACDRSNDGTVVAAHSNFIGKGTGLKAPDWAWAAMDFECHSRYDQGSDMTKEDRRAFWFRAFVKTQDWLWSAGYLVVSVELQAPPPQPAKPKRAIAKGRRLPSRPFPKSEAKIPSRPFPKRAK